MTQNEEFYDKLYVFILLVYTNTASFRSVFIRIPLIFLFNL